MNPQPGNIFAHVPDDLPEELQQDLLTGDGFRVERIVSRGHASPADGGWYDQPQDEWVLLVRGRARLEFEGDPEPVEMTAGDYLHIPARRRHRVAWTDPDTETFWLAIHYHA
jgi:cupin 2 domain-containing protein